MYQKILAGGLFAGVAAGVLAALLQLTFVVPLIQEGELYETGQITHFEGVAAGDAPDHDHAEDGHTDDGHDHGDADADASHSHEEGEGEGSLFQRHMLTFAMFLVSYTGFALVMVAGFALAERFGHRINARTGAVWGLAGFLAVQLAPAFGLPPELPGSSAAALHLRQLWWAYCVIFTVAGAALIGLGRGPVFVIIGIALIALPQLTGAPHAPYGGVSPPELSAHFASRVLAAGAACWLLLGAIAGAIWARDSRRAV